MKKHDDAKGLSADDMRIWLAEEVRSVLKEAELRVKDATEFTTDYATGKLTRKEVDKRFDLYENRWPEALGGNWVGSKTDEEILAAIDKAHQEYIAEHQRKTHEDMERQRRNAELFGLPRGSMGRSR